VLQDKAYRYGSHYLPHDAEVRELGTGRSRVETLQGLGISPIIVPKLSVEDGINAVRKVLPRCWFDKDKCAEGIKALRQYRRDYDDVRKVFLERPYHDWCSHPADAFRYLAIGLQEPRAASGKAFPVRSKGWVI
jgi:phage terminase large subunit